MLEGVVALNETMTETQFYSEYYNHEATEDLPGDSSWDRYIAPRYVFKTMSASVTDGSLDVEFECPTTYAAPSSSANEYVSEKHRA